MSQWATTIEIFRNLERGPVRTFDARNSCSGVETPSTFSTEGMFQFAGICSNLTAPDPFLGCCSRESFPGASSLHALDKECLKRGNPGSLVIRARTAMGYLSRIPD